MTAMEFGEMTSQMLQYGAVSLSVAMAQETGILGILLAADQPLTSVEIAHKAGLKERYVRENLGAMTSGRLVQLVESHSPEDDLRYIVPLEHRPALTKLGVFSLFLSAVSRQFSAVKDCFPLDGPWCVRYNAHVFATLDTAALYKLDETFDILSNSPVIKDKLEGGAQLQAAEFGCGHGRLGRRLASRYPGCQFTLTDVAEAALQKAESQAREEGLTNMNFQIVDVCNLSKDWYGRFDWLLAQNVIHDLPHPALALEGVAKALKPGGVFSLIDEWVASDLRDNVGSDKASLLYTLSTMFCLPESFQKEGSEALGACWGEQRVRTMVEKAGLRLLTIKGGEKMHAGAVYTCQKPE